MLARSRLTGTDSAASQEATMRSDRAGFHPRQLSGNVVGIDLIREVEKGRAEIDAGQAVAHPPVGTRLQQKLTDIGPAVGGTSVAQEGAANLELNRVYLLKNAPEDTKRLVRALCAAPATLLTFPNRRQAGQEEASRELVMPHRVTLCAGTRLRCAHRALPWP
jgi:hypothetical protein